MQFLRFGSEGSGIRFPPGSDTVGVPAVGAPRGDARLRPRAPILLLAAVLGGPATFAQQPIALSVPDGKPQGVRGTVYPDGAIRLHVRDAVLWIQVQNYPDNDRRRAERSPGSWWREPPMMPHPEPYLRVWMELMPGEERVEIDLASVFLTTPEGEPIAPGGYQGPGIGKTDESTDPWYGCGDPPEGLKPKKLRAPPTRGMGWEYDRCYNCPQSAAPFLEIGEPIRVEVPSCFVVRYEVGNNPELIFSLMFDGLTIEGRPAGLPPIPFRMGRIEHFAAEAAPPPVRPGRPGRGP